MSFKEFIQKIDENQKRISSFGKFSEEVLKKINYKLRLDWNYYSNRMEGGTLTKAETRSVMVGNIDVKGKPLKDVAEMAGHDKIVLDVLKMSKGELRISEKRIKDIHKAIMFEDNSELATQIGQWKKDPNEIIGYKNEKILFSQPADVKDEIHSLLNKTNAELDKFFSDKTTVHPIQLAAQFHIDYVSIHPFYDGNGRTSRILTNILLMACGYPIIVIKDDHKKAYYKLLGDIQAYGGEEDLFYAFIAERVLESQNLILDALEGREIEDEDDLYKEIQLWKKSLSDDKKVLKRDINLIREIYKNSIRPLLKLFIEKNEQFEDLFIEKSLIIWIDSQTRHDISDLKSIDSFFEYSEYVNNDVPINENENFPMVFTLKEYSKLTEFQFSIYFKGFKKNGVNMFDQRTELIFLFNEFVYSVNEYRDRGFLLKKLYSEEITVIERESLVKDLVRKTFDNIKSTAIRFNEQN